MGLLIVVDSPIPLVRKQTATVHADSLLAASPRQDRQFQIDSLPAIRTGTREAISAECSFFVPPPPDWDCTACGSGCCLRLSRRIDLDRIQIRSQKSRMGDGPGQFDDTSLFGMISGDQKIADLFFPPGIVSSIVLENCS